MGSALATRAMPAYFNNIVSSITDLTALASAVGTQAVVVRPGTYSLTADLTIPVNVSLHMSPGAVITIATTKTLTINGPFEAGLYQVFSCTGTGKAVFGSGSVSEVYPEWFSGADYGIQINHAIASIKATGGKVKFAYAGEKDVTTSINATNIQTGMIYEGLNTGSVGGPILNGKVAGGVVFDLTGSRYFVIRDLTIRGDSVLRPNVGFLLGRTTGADSVGNCQFFNVKTTYDSHFIYSAIYTCGSEVMDFYCCNVSNNVLGARLFTHTANNIHSITGAYIPLVGGSNSACNIYGGEWVNYGGDPADNFYLEGADDFHVYGGFWYNGKVGSNGRSYIYVDSTNKASNFVSINGIRTDPSATGAYYFILVGDQATQTHLGWSIVGCQQSAVNYVVYIQTDQTLEQWFAEANYDYYNKGWYAAGDVIRCNLRLQKLYIDTGGSFSQSDLWIHASGIMDTVGGALNGCVIRDPYIGTPITGISNFPVGATPSVASGGQLLETLDDTTVTNITDGYGDPDADPAWTGLPAGRIITILFNHVKTITHGTNIFLNGAVNFTSKVGDTLTLVHRADDKWYEMGRSVNT